MRMPGSRSTDGTVSRGAAVEGRTAGARRVVPAGALAVLVFAGVAHAGGLTLTPGGGPPGSRAVASIDCEMPPEFRSRSLSPGAPPATLMAYPGQEDGRGTWTTAIEAGDWDVVVTAACDDRAESARFDVDNPQLAPGPSWAHIGAWRPQLDGTTVIGTDCPSGTTVTVEFSVGGRAVRTEIIDIDSYGDWEVPIPGVEGRPALEVTASCGDLVYEPITVASMEPEVTPTVPGPTGPDLPVTPQAPPTNPPAPPAQPVIARPGYTG